MSDETDMSAKNANTTLDMLQVEARLNQARLSMAIDHEQQLRKLHESAKDTVVMLRSVKLDIDNRAKSIFSGNDESIHHHHNTKQP